MIVEKWATYYTKIAIEHLRLKCMSKERKQCYNISYLIFGSYTCWPLGIDCPIFSSLLVCMYVFVLLKFICIVWHDFQRRKDEKKIYLFSDCWWKERNFASCPSFWVTVNWPNKKLTPKHEYLINCMYVIAFFC